MTSEDRVDQLRQELEATRKAAVFLALEFMSKRPGRRADIAAELYDLAATLHGPEAELARLIAGALEEDLS